METVDADTHAVAGDLESLLLFLISRKKVREKCINHILTKEIQKAGIVSNACLVYVPEIRMS
jgi:hypothetical protein